MARNILYFDKQQHAPSRDPLVYFQTISTVQAAKSWRAGSMKPTIRLLASSQMVALELRADHTAGCPDHLRDDLHHQ